MAIKFGRPIEMRDQRPPAAPSLDVARWIALMRLTRQSASGFAGKTPRG